MRKNNRGGITSKCSCQCFFILLRAFCKNTEPLRFGNDLWCNTISFSRTIPPKQPPVVYDSAFYELIIIDFYPQRKGTLGHFSVQITLFRENKIAVERPFFRNQALSGDFQSGQFYRQLNKSHETIQPTLDRIAFAEMLCCF